MKNPLAVLVILALSCTVIQANNESSLFLMPVKPLQYDLYIDISLEASSFNGKVDIKFKLLSSTNNITINAFELEITDKIRVFYKGKEREFVQKIDKKKDTVNILFDRMLEKGTYVIKIDYKGNFTTSMIGLRLINYDFDELKFSRAMAVTYLQPTYAKYVFPCFDDPKLKANFNISISRDKDNIATSNMPLRFSKDIGNNQALDVFELTPKFSTNEVAFAVFNYSYASSYPRGNFYAKPGPEYANYDHRKYLTDNSESILRGIENYFHMPLPMEKVDIMGVPELPTKGDGIGNWGLILVLEDNLFLNNKVKKTMGEQNTLMSLINAYLHGLLGHVCNQASDGCSILIEGIAIFLQYSIGDQLKPDWRLTEQRALILLRDVVQASHPDVFSLQRTPEELPEKDVYELYRKTAALMLTLQSMVRRHNFQLGLQHFAHRSMDICSFGETVTPNNFWVSLQEVVDIEKPKIDFNPPLKIKSIAKIMKTWEQPDFVPMLYVIRNYYTAPFEFTFMQSALSTQVHQEPREWYIPINYATQSKPYLFKLLRATGGFMEPYKPYTFPHDVGYDEWFIINVEAAYHYLVQYDDTNWSRIVNALNSENFGNIPPLTRAKLLYDAFTLALFDKMPFNVALELTKYLWRERDYIPLNSLFYVLEIFYSRYAGSENFHHFEAYISKALQPALEHVGFQKKEPPRHIDHLNRLQLIKWLCLFGNQLCRKTATNMLLENYFLLSVDMREVVVCAGQIEANATVWNKLGEYNTDQADQAITNGFGCSQHETYLSINIENNLNMHISVFHNIYSRGYFGINFVLKYLMDNWEKVNKSLMVDDKKDLISNIAELITTNVQLSMLQNISTVPLELNKTFEKAINRAISRISLLKQHSGVIAAWIQKEIINEGSSTVKVSFYVLFVILIILFNFLS